MRTFRFTEDVEDWLEPMDYQGFWYAIAPYDLELQPREHCDRLIKNKQVDAGTILCGLKSMAELELTRRHDLKRKIINPWISLVESH